MTKFLRYLSLILLMLTTACATEAGRGWGEVELQIQSRLPVPDGRFDEQAKAYNTADDYHVRLESFDFSIVGLKLLSAGSAELSFDPAKPPPPFTNCHAGHCHRTDSPDLPSYAEVEAILKKQNTAGAEKLLDLTLDLPYQLPASNPISLAKDAEVQKGKVQNLQILVEKLEFKGQYKKKTDSEWQSFSYSLPSDKSLSLQGKVDELNFDRSEPYRRKLDVFLELSLNFIDKRQWSDLAQDKDLLTSLEKTLIISTQDPH